MIVRYPGGYAHHHGHGGRPAAVGGAGRGDPGRAGGGRLVVAGGCARPDGRAGRPAVGRAERQHRTGAGAGLRRPR
ncbi:hypothetical protein FHG89_04345 [Micromonospora orduensis]|uniref:Uncharacterized protein n=1 Tax=Micromonospora orduensis TaxID=1420891 RepID=A0A5C4QYG1_9ACTN|nr:hypothetical protein FHG89_04345 [Micromonospora orduensis]